MHILDNHEQLNKYKVMTGNSVNNSGEQVSDYIVAKRIERLLKEKKVGETLLFKKLVKSTKRIEHPEDMYHFVDKKSGDALMKLCNTLENDGTDAFIRTLFHQVSWK